MEAKPKITKLLKFAKWLEETNFNRFRMKWNFEYVNFGKRNGNHCGTAGCAIGHLPYFTNEIKFYNSLGMMYKKERIGFFGITFSYFHLGKVVSEHLFIADHQNIKKFGGFKLTDRSTPEDVAYNIREFVKKIKYGRK